MMDSSTLLEKGIFGKAVTEPTLLKIMEAGYTRIGDLTRTLPDELAANAGIGSDTAMKVIQLAFTHSTNYETGNDVMEAQKDLVRLNTGCTGLNTLLGGGYQSGHITELIGGFSAGKTQACFTAAVMCTRPVEEGGLDGSVLWMDTEATFSGKRVAEIASTRGYDVSETLSKIYRVDIANSLHQEALTSNLRIPIQEYGVKLVIVDSMIGKLRGEYIGLQNLSPRQQKLGSMLNHLLRISRPKFGFNIPIIITNQVQTQINVMFGDPNRGAGGNIIAHAGDPRVMLRKGRGDTSLASIIDSSELAPGKVRIRITAGGIMDE